MVKTKAMIDGYDGQYEIYSDGRIYSHKRTRFLKGSIDGKGYPIVILTFWGYQKRHRIGRLVGKHFVDGYKKGLRVAHIDGDKTNSDYKNIAWVTRSESQRRDFESGRVISRKGATHSRAKLTEEDVFDIRLRLKAGQTQKNIAAFYGVSQDAISSIKTRKAWKHI